LAGAAAGLVEASEIERATSPQGLGVSARPGALEIGETKID